MKLAMMIGLQIPGVLRFVSLQAEGILAADLLAIPGAVMRSRDEWLEKLGLVCSSRILGPFWVGCFLWVAYVETRELMWAAVSSRNLGCYGGKRVKPVLSLGAISWICR